MDFYHIDMLQFESSDILAFSNGLRSSDSNRVGESLNDDLEDLIRKEIMIDTEVRKSPGVARESSEKEDCRQILNS